MAVSTTNCEGKLIETAFVGAPEKADRKFYKSMASAYKALKGLKCVNIGVECSGAAVSDKALSRAMGEVFILADYDFDDYKSDKKPPTVANLFFKGIANPDMEAFKEGEILAESNIHARVLVNAPSNAMTPEKLAEYAKKHCGELGIEVEVKERDEIEKLGMESFLSVARASDLPPKLIVMRWKGGGKDGETLGLVGKGLTYDSGGLSIKPTNGMITMKCDMAGSAAVIGAMIGIARLDVKTNVTAVVAACENMISGRSFRPGDIIGSMAGKSIFIGNTDAEGRLTLVDAVTYIIEKEKVDRVLDIATLTGAAVRALGETVAAVVSNDESFYKKLDKSYSKSNEQHWRMPLLDDHRELLKHHEADLTNSAGGPGMMTAALFIEPFVKRDGKEIPWVHVDIAGPAFAEKPCGLHGKGGTGCAARPLIRLAKRFEK